MEMIYAYLHEHQFMMKSNLIFKLETDSIQFNYKLFELEIIINYIQMNFKYKLFFK